MPTAVQIRLSAAERHRLKRLTRSQMSAYDLMCRVGYDLTCRFPEAA